MCKYAFVCDCCGAVVFLLPEMPQDLDDAPGDDVKLLDGSEPTPGEPVQCENCGVIFGPWLDRENITEVGNETPV